MKRVNRYLILLVTLCFTLSLAGCKKADPDPNSGLYEAVSATGMGMELAITDLYDNGVSFDLKDGGKAVVNLDGQEFNIKWSHDGNSFHAEGGGAEFEGTIGDGVLNLEDMMGMGIDMKLVCSDLPNAGAVSDGSSENTPAVSGSLLTRLKDAKMGQPVYVAATDVSDDTDDDNDDEYDGETEAGASEGDDVDTDDGSGGSSGVATEYSIQNGLDDSFFGDGVVDAQTLAEFYIWWGDLPIDEKQELGNDFQAVLVEKLGTKPIDTSEEFEEGLCHTQYVTPEGDGKLLILWKKSDDGVWRYSSLSPGGTVYDTYKELSGE